MGSRGIKGIVFLGLIAALAAVALQLSNYSLSPPDNRGIGGDWKPYALDAHSKMDNYFRVNGNEGVYTTNSEGDSQIYIRIEPAGTMIQLTAPPDDFPSSTMTIILEEAE